MFKKVVIGFIIFSIMSVMALGLVAVTGLAVVGAAVGSAFENLDVSTLEVTDANGHTETYNVGDLVSETNRVEIISEDGEQVSIDLNLPQVAIQENGDEASRVVINGDDVSRVVIGSDPGIEISEDSQISFNGRHDYDFDGGFFGRIIGGVFRGVCNMIFWIGALIGIVLIVRHQNSKSEKSPEAVA